MRSWTWVALGVASLVLAPRARAQTDPPELESPERGAAAEPAHAEDRNAEPPWRWPGAVVWDLELRLAIPPETGFDRALRAHGYGDVRIIPAVIVGVAAPVLVEWLWIGGRAGVRGRTWDHAERTAASLVGADLLATVQARVSLGRVELGLLVGAGLGWMGTWVNGVMSDQLAPRFSVQGDLAFRIGHHFAFGPSVGWDYFQTPAALNAYGHGADSGGPYVGLSLEGRQ